MTKINRDAPVSVPQIKSTEPKSGALAPTTATSAATVDGFKPASVAAPVDETKMDIVCPLMGALVNSGKVKLDKNGRMSAADLAKAVYNNVGVTGTLAVGVLLAAPTANKPGDILRNFLGMSFNPLKLRSGIIKHPNDSMILEHGKFDEAKFQALAAHAENGKLTERSYGAFIAENVKRDGTDKGVTLSQAEAAAALNLFGSIDPKTGERFITVDTLRNLYQFKQLPPEGLMMSRPRSGLGDLKSTMARIAAAMPMGTSAGDSAQGVRMSLGDGASASVASNATISAGKARCPHMQGAGMKPPPVGVDQIAALHDTRD